MITYPSNQFKKVKTIYGAFTVTDTAVAKSIANYPCTVVSLTGNLWINPDATAVADETAIKLLTGDSIDLSVFGNLSLISDTDGATAQVIVWDF